MYKLGPEMSLFYLRQIPWNLVKTFTSNSLNTFKKQWSFFLKLLIILTALFLNQGKCWLHRNWQAWTFTWKYRIHKCIQNKALGLGFLMRSPSSKKPVFSRFSGIFFHLLCLLQCRQLSKNMTFIDEQSDFSKWKFDCL